MPMESRFLASLQQQNLKVIEDICKYFAEKLNLELEIYSANSARDNLSYRVFERESEVENIIRPGICCKKKTAPPSSMCPAPTKHIIWQKD